MTHDIKTQISEYRDGERNTMRFWTPDSFREDTKFQEFLLTEILELRENNELNILSSFLTEIKEQEYISFATAETLANRLLAQATEICQAGDADMINELGKITSILEKIDYPTTEILEFISDYASSTDSIEEALELRYRFGINLYKDSDVIANYFVENGINPFTVTPGEGYYTDKKDTSSKYVVGLPNSPLYDARSATYLGDLEYIHEYGVELNDYYEETRYDRYKQYFRGNSITFRPTEMVGYETIWSGNYLFLFNEKDGRLVNYTGNIT